MMDDGFLILDKSRDFVRVNNLFWSYYINRPEADKLVDRKCGKWMHFFRDIGFADGICKEAILSGICAECKHTSKAVLSARKTGVICFYLNGDDIKAHRRVIRFMLDHDLIPKTKTGRLYNNGFKYDDQTRAGKYGDDFVSQIKLADFVDLETGSFLQP